jgi:hypothetical protein
MPPHCDSLDGPVVKAAVVALEKEDVNVILPYVPAEGEAEVKEAFRKVLPLRKNGAREVADLYFFETVVRIHRAGEGAPFTGLKPAGLDVGPVIPVAERAIESGKVDELEAKLTGIVAAEVRKRFAHMQHLKAHAAHGVAAAREYTSAMLGLQVWAHGVYLASLSEPHGEGGGHHHG